MKSIQTSMVLTALAGLATCADVCQYKANRSKDPSGNPLRQPSLDTQVPRGTGYEIKWDPTTSGTVSIALLRGPSSNAEEFACLANSIQNSGSFSWTPSTDLEIDTSRYGLKIIVDATGDYQFSAQFGIKKGDNEQSATPSATKSASSSSSSTSTQSQSAPSPTGTITTKRKKTHKSYHASGTGYVFKNDTTSAYKTGGTTSKKTTITKSASSTPNATPSTSVAVAYVSNTPSNPGVSTQVVGVGGGANAATATATAQSPASTTPAAFPTNGAESLKVTSVLLCGVAAAMFFLL